MTTLDCAPGRGRGGKRRDRPRGPGHALVRQRQRRRPGRRRPRRSSPAALPLRHAAAGRPGRRRRSMTDDRRMATGGRRPTRPRIALLYREFPESAASSTPTRVRDRVGAGRPAHPVPRHHPRGLLPGGGAREPGPAAGGDRRRVRMGDGTGDRRDARRPGRTAADAPAVLVRFARPVRLGPSPAAAVEEPIALEAIAAIALPDAARSIASIAGCSPTGCSDVTSTASTARRVLRPASRGTAMKRRRRGSTSARSRAAPSWSTWPTARELGDGRPSLRQRRHRRAPAGPDDDVALAPDWALQDPDDYLGTFQRPSRALLAETGVDPADVDRHRASTSRPARCCRRPPTARRSA